GFDPDMRTGLAEALEAQGIRQHPNRTIARVDADRTVTLDDGAAIPSDLVFSALGRRPNTAGLGLDRAGVATNADGAVVVDAEGRSSVEGVYAIGDVTNRLNLTPVAIAEGHSLADRLFGQGPRRWELDAVATAVFSSPPIATVGMTEDQAAARGAVDIYISRFTPMRHTLSRRVRKTVMKLVVDQASQRVLGAHMLGEDAPEIMQGLSVAINCGATKADFDRTVGIHPTAAEEFVTMRTRTRVAGIVEAAAAE
ncbi:MAG TPA: FAD-dependent oxidoreductase, partial [Acetobacteraceae bacterium]